MSGRRAEVRPGWLAVALAVGIVPLTMTWTAVVPHPDAVLFAAGLAAAILAVSAALRLMRLDNGGTFIVQLLLVFGALFHVASGASTPAASLAAVSATITRIGDDGLIAVGTDIGAQLLLTAVIGLLTILADALAISWRHPVGVLAPLLALYLVPAHLSTGHDALASGLALLALSFGATLLAGRPGRFLAGRDGMAARVGVLGLGALVTALALVFANALAPAIAPPATNRTNQPLQMTDISLDLKREISRGDNAPALRYTTTSPQGEYLRLYALPAVDSTGWKLTDSRVRSGWLPAPPGLDHPTRQHTDITITGFTSEWLPSPYAPSSTTAGDGWGYLPSSLSLLALARGDRASATAGLHYSVESVEARPTPDEIRSASAGRPVDDPASAQAPQGVPASIVSLSHSVTASSPTAGAKALAIQHYLTSAPFTYSLDATPGSGYDGLVAFLTKDHKGFCVQYAASMALMARIEGIPSRVAIGFTPGTRSGDHWNVTMHDMHAWPELYFEGWGWVAFEATPGMGTGAGGTATPSPSASPSAQPTQASPSAGASAPAGVPSAVPAPSGAGDSMPGALTRALTVLLIVLVALLVLACPALIRRGQRSRRLAERPDDTAGSALGAWSELRALVVDHRRAWPDGSPRVALTQLSESLSADAATASGPDGGGQAGSSHPADRQTRLDEIPGMAELALAAERALYAPPGRVDSGAWVDVVARASRALDAADTRGGRLRAHLWPASVWRGIR